MHCTGTQGAETSGEMVLGRLSPLGHYTDNRLEHIPAFSNHSFKTERDSCFPYRNKQRVKQNEETKDNVPNEVQSNGHKVAH